jgi:aspartyl-tRNA(Asn)/glutamyl-tRNA(Gln) amidotransferase subunit B
LNERKLEIHEFPITPEALRGALKLRIDGLISSNGLTDLITAMLTDVRDAETIAKEQGLIQVSDTSFLEPWVDEVIAGNMDKVKAYNSGKDGLLGFFVGNVMRASQGKANPQLVSDMVIRKLKEQS